MYFQSWSWWLWQVPNKGDLWGDGLPSHSAEPQRPMKEILCSSQLLKVMITENEILLLFFLSSPFKQWDGAVIFF